MKAYALCCWHRLFEFKRTATIRTRSFLLLLFKAFFRGAACDWGVHGTAIGPTTSLILCKRTSGKWMRSLFLHIGACIPRTFNSPYIFIFLVKIKYHLEVLHPDDVKVQAKIEIKPFKDMLKFTSHGSNVPY